MSYITESLSEGEALAHLFNHHWMAKIRFYILAVLSIPTIGVLAPFAIYEWLRLRSIEQGVTNKRAVLKRGIIRRDTEEMRLASVETVEIAQSMLGRMFGYGDIKLTGRGLSDLLYKGIDDPLQVKKLIEGQLG